MQPFALAFDHPRPSLAGVSLGAIGWRGIGPLDVPILVRGDGLIVFDFPQSVVFHGPEIPGYQPSYDTPTPSEVVKAEATRLAVGYARLEYMNAWVAAYMAGMGAIARHAIITPPPADPWNHLKGFEQDTTWHVFDNEHKLVRGRDGLTPVDPGVFDYALEVMEAAQSSLGGNFTAALALFQQACFQYRVHQFATAHILGWSLAEQVLNTLWLRYQHEASSGPHAVTALSRARRKQLNGRDFSASIISQTLSLAGRIPDEKLAKLDNARRSRNAFAHSLEPVTGPDAQNAITTASEMLSDLLGIRLYPNLSNTFWM